MLPLPMRVSVILWLMALTSVACEKESEPIDLPFELLAQDANATQAPPQDVTSPAYRIFRDTASWDAWKQPGPQEKPDANIDFSSEMLLAVFMGEKPTGGYGIAVTAVESRGDKVVVTVEETHPPANAMLMQVITHPYAIYRISLPPGTSKRVTDASIEFQVLQEGAPEPVAFQRLP